LPLGSVPSTALAKGSVTFTMLLLSRAHTVVVGNRWQFSVCHCRYPRYLFLPVLDGEVFRDKSKSVCVRERRGVRGRKIIKIIYSLKVGSHDTYLWYWRVSFWWLITFPPKELGHMSYIKIVRNYIIFLNLLWNCSFVPCTG
jgi:hypothetical protein